MSEAAFWMLLTELEAEGWRIVSCSDLSILADRPDDGSRFRFFVWGRELTYLHGA